MHFCNFFFAVKSETFHCVTLNNDLLFFFKNKQKKPTPKHLWTEMLRNASSLHSSCILIVSKHLFHLLPIVPFTAWIWTVWFLNWCGWKQATSISLFIQCLTQMVVVLVGLQAALQFWLWKLTLSFEKQSR